MSKIIGLFFGYFPKNHYLCNMKVDVIIGSNLGDEGKGTVVANCVKNTTGSVLNVLTNGGSQRAHSILTKDGSFTFQHFGSGTYNGADSYFSKFFIINPMQFVKEYSELINRGIILKDKVYRHPDCMWSTPYDMMANQIKEDERKSQKHGSCGMGIWETVKRYKSVFNISFDNFISLPYEQKVSFLQSIKSYFEREITLTGEWVNIWNDNGIIEHFISDCEFLNSATTILIKPEVFDNIIFENGQGLMLNDTGYDKPGTTPSFTGSQDAIELSQEWGIEQSNVVLHYVTRPYMTRHGAGHLYGECHRSNISNSIAEDRTNHYNKFQDDFRFGFLDINDLKSRIDKDNFCNLKKIIEVTHCDEMDRESEFKKVFTDVNFTDSPLI